MSEKNNMIERLAEMGIVPNANESPVVYNSYRPFVVDKEISPKFFNGGEDVIGQDYADGSQPLKKGGRMVALAAEFVGPDFAEPDWFSSDVHTELRKFALMHSIEVEHGSTKAMRELVRHLVSIPIAKKISVSSAAGEATAMAIVDRPGGIFIFQKQPLLKPAQTVTFSFSKNESWKATEALAGYGILVSGVFFENR